MCAPKDPLWWRSLLTFFVASMSTPRLYHEVRVLQDGRVIAAGGVDARSGGSELNTAEIYNPRMSHIHLHHTHIPHTPTPSTP